MERIKHIVLITTGQPTTNPRLVKEADALQDAGYKVTVIYQYISDWATKYDATLLATKSWKAVCVGGTPTSGKFSYLLNKILYRAAVLTSNFLGFKFGIAENAIARGVLTLTKAAKTIEADLYIAHNLGALPAAVKAARKFKTKCGFDAEDFHRHELSDNQLDFDVKIKKFTENKLIPKLDYLTASSPLISMKYGQIFKKKNTVILNTFPKVKLPSPANIQGPLRFFWFSQTIGKGRGIELVIDVLNDFDKPFELHLLGNEVNGFLADCELKAKFKQGKLIFHNPIAQDQIFDFCRTFDIGLCLEQNQPLNRNICLTNKIFTYLQAGLAIIASNTQAQEAFLTEYEEIGFIYKTKNELLNIIKNYDANRSLLNQHKTNSFVLGQQRLNWEIEKQKFLSVIKQTLSN